jgi:hypothetical protein
VHPQFRHLSTTQGGFPVPNSGNQQTASLVLDIDRDGVNDFVITERAQAPAVVWYRRHAGGWTRHVLEAGPLRIEAGGAFHDLTGNGAPDIVFGGDSGSNAVWWWENPHPHHDPNTPWKRRVIKASGANKHHDQLFGDFDGDGQVDLVSWNQGAHRRPDRRRATRHPGETLHLAGAAAGCLPQPRWRAPRLASPLNLSPASYAGNDSLPLRRQPRVACSLACSSAPPRFRRPNSGFTTPPSPRRRMITVSASFTFAAGDWLTAHLRNAMVPRFARGEHSTLHLGGGCAMG